MTREPKKGGGSGGLLNPGGLAVSPTGEVYVADSGNNRVEIFSETGTYIGQITKVGTVALKKPIGVAVASSNAVYILDSEVEPEQYAVFKTNAKAELLGEFANNEESGKCGAAVYKPKGIALSGSGDVYVTSSEACVAEFNSGGKWLRKLSSASLKQPSGVGVGPNGYVYVADTSTDKVSQFNEAGTNVGTFGAAGTGNGQFTEPTGVAVAPSGDVYVVDTGNSRVEKWGGPSSGPVLTQATVYDPATGNVVETRPPAVQEEQAPKAYTFKFAFGTSGTENGQFSKPSGVAVAANGNVYVLDAGNDRVQEFSSSGGYLGQFGKKGGGSGGLLNPGGLAVSPTGEVYVADSGNNRVEIFSETGTYIGQITKVGTVALIKPIGVAVASRNAVYILDSEVEYGEYAVFKTNAKAELLGEYANNEPGTKCSSSAGGSAYKAKGIALSGSGNLYVTSSEACVTEFNSGGKWLRTLSSATLKQPSGLAVGPNGYVYVVDTSTDKVSQFNEAGEYISAFGTPGTGNGQFTEPVGIAVAQNGYLWNGALYVADTANNRVEDWSAPVPNLAAHITQTIYYGAEIDKTYPQCGQHPEWANLPCQTQPAAQPEGSLPNLPVTTMTYNIWDAPETVTETFKAGVRKRQTHYDTAGRQESSKTTASGTSDSGVPAVSEKYSASTGALIEESSNVGEKTETLKSTFNTIGELTAYTDAEGATAGYHYDEDGRVIEVNDGQAENRGVQTYKYNATTGALSELHDSGAGAFSASYDVEGRMLTEGYPNAMTATYTYNQTGEATGLTYTKTANCGESCTWFSDMLVPSVHGEAMSQASTLASESYAYDNGGRLTQVQETPAGKGCTTRLYAYDEESNRTSLTTRAPGSKGECTSEGGTVQAHSYDEANRLEDAGVSYEELGDATKVPAADAGEQELTAGYYTDGQTAKTSQNGESISYTYDPAGRSLAVVSSGKTSGTNVEHYAGSGEAISWTSEGAEKWSRKIPGIDGTLTAIEKSGEGAELQLHDLQGNVVATASKYETETKLLHTYNSTEFGVPTTSSPPRYAWLGATGLETELPSGISSSGSVSYVPQLGLDLQTQPVVPPGAAPSGSYSGAVYDPSPSGEDLGQADSYGAGAAVRQAEREKAANEEAERTAAAGRCNIASCLATPEPNDGGASTVFFESFAVAGGGSPGLGAVVADNLLGKLEGGLGEVLKVGEEGGKIAKSAMEAGAKFVKRNAGKFVAILSDFGTMAEAGLALGAVGGSCFAGAVGATFAAPLASPFVWFGCGTFTFGEVLMFGYSGYDAYKTVKGIKQ